MIVACTAGNLDPATSVGIMRLLDRINRTGTTVVMATHDHAIVDAMQRRVVALDHGRVIRDQQVGRYEAVLRETMEMDTPGSQSDDADSQRGEAEDGPDGSDIGATDTGEAGQIPEPAPAATVEETEAP